MLKQFFKLLFLCVTISCNSQQQLNAEQQQIVNAAKANLVFVEGGTFIMGNNIMRTATEHEVTLDSYAIAKYETTFKEFDVFTDTKGLEKAGVKYREDEDLGQNYGVMFVSWQQSKDYCEWLGEQLNLPITLPTEAQWEYAARSRGLKVDHATDNGKIVGSYTVERNYSLDKPVGFYKPNPLGIYDMSGSKPEWVSDYITAYGSEAVKNPRVDSIDISNDKVVRGFHNLQNSTSLRSSKPQELTGAGIGFRCVCNQKTPVN